MEYKERTYRLLGENKDLVEFFVKVRETDLLVKAKKNLQKKTIKIVEKYRYELEKYIKGNKLFLESLKPIDTDDTAPHIVKEMIRYAQIVGVGPMAGIAGAMALYIGKRLKKYTDEFIVENGGDIALLTKKERIIYIYTGEESPFKEKIFLKIAPKDEIYGIATSSGKIGPSLSFGKADTVTILSPSPILSDMVATKIGNLIKSSDDIERAIYEGKKIQGVDGILITIGDKIGIWGDVNLYKL